MEGRSFIYFVGFVHILKQTFILKEGSDSTDSGIGITHSKNFAVGRSGIICEPFAKKDGITHKTPERSCFVRAFLLQVKTGIRLFRNNKNIILCGY